MRCPKFNTWRNWRARGHGISLLLPSSAAPIVLELVEVVVLADDSLDFVENTVGDKPRTNTDDDSLPT
jgi:hypothetical protein